MTSKMKKNEAYEKIKEYIKKHPGVTKTDLEDKKKCGFSRNTVWYNLYSEKGKLKNKVEIVPISGPNGKVDTYYLREDENEADPNYLRLLMDQYKKNRMELTNILTKKKITSVDKKIFKPLGMKLSLIINDMERICFYKKITDEDFVDFVIVESTDNYIPGPTHLRLWNCLSILSNNLYINVYEKKDRDNKTELSFLDKILKSGDFFEKIIIDKEKWMEERLGALRLLSSMKYPKHINIAFKLLLSLETKKKETFTPPFPFFSDIETKRDTEFTFMFPTIKEIIMRYSRINYVNCREILYKVINFSADKLILQGLMDIWKETSIGYEDEKNKQFPF